VFRRRRGILNQILPTLRPRRRRLAAIPPSPQEIAIQQALQRAHRLMEVGDYATAAPLFEQMARQTAGLGHPRQAAHLFLQAGRARISSGQTSLGVSHLKEGLGILARSEQWEAFDRVGARAIGELDLHGQPQSAQDLAQWITAQRPKTAEPKTAPRSSASLPVEILPAAASAAPARLPLKCPSCGAPIRPDDVEWRDKTTAECDYCGSQIRAE